MSADERRRPLACLMGPTAAGKTDVAVELASRRPIDIISVDSAMVYRHMDIGTGKPEAAVLARAPHALIDIRDPHDTYSAAQFAQEATNLVLASWDKGRVPLLVGGTGLYYRALLSGLSPLPEASPQLREELEGAGVKHGLEYLHQWLGRVDPVTAARLHPHDHQRITRALEVCLLGNVPMSEQIQGAGTSLTATVIKLVLAPAERAVLHQRIETRFDHMLEMGLVNEVRTLMRRPELERTSPSMRAVGYRQTWDYLVDDTSFKQLRERGQAATRQLARRQLTWLRKEPEAVWLDASSKDMTDVAESHFAPLFT
jgi:tRNA dimethylallyltransferase